MPLIRSYKMTSDTGFAPNPKGGVITLATCKPYIRKIAQLGDWIAGFTSKSLRPEYGDGEPKLIYLMCVDRALTFEDFFAQYGESERKDCIYRGKPGNYVRVQGVSKHHTEIDLITRDLSVDRVLVASEFYYFGRVPLSVNQVAISVPLGPSPYGCKTCGDPAKEFINFVREHATKIGRINRPHGDESNCKCSCNPRNNRHSC